MSIAAITQSVRAPFNPLTLRLAAAIGCAALADWLFFGWEMGVSLALFLGVLGVAAVACNGVRAARPVRMIMITVFVAGLAALFENVDMLSIAIGMLATAMFIIVMTSDERAPWYRNLFEAATVPFRGPFRFVGDMIRALRHIKERTSGWLGWLVAWIVPLSIFAVFLALFSSANPLIEGQLMRIDFRPLLDLHQFPAAHPGLDQPPDRSLARRAEMTDRVETDEALRAQGAVEQIGRSFPQARRLRRLVPAEMPIHQLIGFQHAVALADGERAGIERQL